MKIIKVNFKLCVLVISLFSINLLAVTHASFQASTDENYIALAIYACSAYEARQTRVYSVDVENLSQIKISKTDKELKFTGECKINRISKSEYKGVEFEMIVNKEEFIDKVRDGQPVQIVGKIGELNFKYNFVYDSNLLPVVNFFQVTIPLQNTIFLKNAKVFDAVSALLNLDPTNKEIRAIQFAMPGNSEINIESLGVRDGRNPILYSHDGQNFYLQFFTYSGVKGLGEYGQAVAANKADGIYFLRKIHGETVISGCSFYTDGSPHQFSTVESCKEKHEILNLLNGLE